MNDLLLALGVFSASMGAAAVTFPDRVAGVAVVDFDGTGRFDRSTMRRLGASTALLGVVLVAVAIGA